MRLGNLDAVKRAIEDRIDSIPSNDYDQGWNAAINTAIDEIDNTPTIEERQKGEWIERIEGHSNGYPFGGVNCSLCGHQTTNRFHLIFGCPYNFCPNCGAQMYGGEDHD